MLLAKLEKRTKTRGWLAVEPVLSELVSAAASLLTGKEQGRFGNWWAGTLSVAKKSPIYQPFKPEFPTHSNRETNRRIRDRSIPKQGS
jgi:hypothetical protein